MAYGAGAYERRSAPGLDLVPITPSDDVTTANEWKSLRIYNTNTVTKALSFVTFAGETRHIKVPPGLSFEPTVVKNVLDAGTDQADLEIHGYVD